MLGFLLGHFPPHLPKPSIFSSVGLHLEHLKPFQTAQHNEHTQINTQQQKGPTMTLEQIQAIIAVVDKKHQLALKQLQRAQRAETPAQMLRILTDNKYVDKLKLNAERRRKTVEYWQYVADSNSYKLYDFAYFGKKFKLNG